MSTHAPSTEPVGPVGVKECVERPDWTTYFLNIAQAVAERADCRRRRVGAVIVGRDNRIVSTGFNGAPAGRPGCLEGACPRGLLSFEELQSYASYDEGPGRCISSHAEANAIIYADWARMQGASLYCTEEPCNRCRITIEAAGIFRVAWPSPGNPGLINAEYFL